jgi:AraC-like DNA-binding protein
MFRAPMMPQTTRPWLREDDTPVAVLASRLGYESEAAFSRVGVIRFGGQLI